MLLASDLTIDGTAAADTIIISQTQAGKLSVLINNTLVEPDLTTGDIAAIKIDGKGLADRVEFQGTIDLAGIDLSVQAEEIFVAASANLTAKDITFAARGEDAGLSVADNLPISVIVSNRSITLEPGAELNAQAIDLSAMRIASLISSYRTLGGGNKSATISLDGATLNATEAVTIAADTEDVALLDSVPAAGNNFALSPVSRFIFDGIFPSIPLGLMIRGSESHITVKDTAINAGGDVTIQSTSKVDASTWAIGMDLDGLDDLGMLAKVLNKIAVGYSQANSDATIDVIGVSAIDSQGSVDIVSESSAVAGVSAATRLNTGQPKPGQSADSKAFGFSVAVSVSDTTAKTYLGPDTAVTAYGNVNVNALGSSSNSAAAGVSIYVDGTGGAGLAFGNDSADVTAIVDGDITSVVGAATTLELPVRNIVRADNTIFLPGHGLKTGDELLYVSENPDKDNPEDYADIGGLSNGLEYRVIVVDDDHIQLATTQSIELDARGTRPNAIHQFTLQQTVEFDPASAVDSANDRLQVPAIDLAEGALVSYGAANSEIVTEIEPIGGLADSQVYNAIN
ncbi:MAG: hypothetical protein KDB23_27950, partial [Planctomycetales bacterium]|nr:hypothetical protein [Planctomycetales bacterium]